MGAAGHVRAACILCGSTGLFWLPACNWCSRIGVCLQVLQQELYCPPLGPAAQLGCCSGVVPFAHLQASCVQLWV